MNFDQSDTTRSSSYEFLEDLVDYDEALEELENSSKDGIPHIPTFAQRMLERLKEVGLLHRIDVEPPRNVRKVKLDRGQDVWVRFDRYRDRREGYMAVDVVDAPRSDRAILAAMVAWLGQPVDFEQLLEASRFFTFTSPESKAQIEKIEKSMNRMYEEVEDFGYEEWKALVESLSDLLEKIETGKPVRYILPLLRYYKPEVTSYSSQEMNDLMKKACGYINDFLDSLRKLQAFLEYGTPNRNLAPSIKEPGRDMKAAILHDVNGLNYRQIGERMGIPLPPDFEVKGEHQTVRKMVQRGQRILEDAFSKEG